MIGALATSEVVTVGRQWHLMWEDGQAGIYQFKSKATTVVSKTTELADTHSDGPHLANDLPDRVACHALNKVIVQQGAREVVNAIKVPSAMGLLGLAGLEGTSGNGNHRQDDDPSDGASVRLGRRPAAIDHPARVHAPDAATHDPVPSGQDDDAHSVYASYSIWEKIGSAGAPSQAALKTGPKASAKAKAGKQAKQPKSKAAPNSLAANTGIKPKTQTNNRRGQAEGEDADAAAAAEKKARVSSIFSLEPASNLEGTDNKACSMSKAMVEGDEKWRDDMKETMQQALNIVPRGDEESFKSDMSKVMQSLTALLTEVRTRKRNVRRRTAENSEKALKEADSFEDLLNSALALLKSIKQGTANGDELLSSITLLQKSEVCKASFGVAVITRTTRALLLDDLRWQRWEQMISVSFAFAQRAGRLAPDSPPHSQEDDFLCGFLAQQMCILLQKLLKSITVDLVT